MPISQTEGYFKNPLYHFLEESMLFLLLENENPKKKHFGMLRQKLLKEATIHFYYLCDGSRFSDICTIIELKELN